MHVRAALRNGLTPDEIKEVLLQTAVYCGVPAANSAFAIAQEVLAEEAAREPRPSARRSRSSAPARRASSLAQLLHLQGIDSVVLEARSREYVERRIRAGVLEHGTVELLSELGVSARFASEGLPHHGIELQFGGAPAPDRPAASSPAGTSRSTGSRRW